MFEMIKKKLLLLLLEYINELVLELHSHVSGDSAE